MIDLIQKVIMKTHASKTPLYRSRRGTFIGGRVAIIHDIFIEFGGAERTLLALLEMYPSADVYCPLIAKNNVLLVERYTKGKLFTSWLSYAPLAKNLSSFLKPFIFEYWEALDLSAYHLVISSSHSFSSKSVITGPQTRHVAYIYTPPRYLYAEYNEREFLRREPWRTLFSPLLSWLRCLDYIGAQRPDMLIAISKNIQKRIRKYYRRESIVVYPPVSVSVDPIKNWRNGEYYICVSRLAKQKGTRLIIDACNRYQLPLCVVGVGEQMKTLKRFAGPTVKFLGYVPDNKMHVVYNRARALLYCSLDEDFGIVPVEANAHGLPVVAYASGGVRETIMSGKNGILFDTYTPRGLFESIEKLNDSDITSQTCHKIAANFSQEQFMYAFARAIAPKHSAYENL